MRIHLAGSFLGLEPVFLIFTAPGTYSFDKTLYPDHTIYDIMVIGGGGGRGGGLEGQDPNYSNWNNFNYGGSGGGGGSHRLQGLLEILGDTTQVIVGAAGSDGTDGGSNPANATDGGDGEASSFGGFVIATGGKGGKRAQSLSWDDNMLADGGDGGIGGIGSPAGGGGVGGICGLNDDPENPGLSAPGTDGGDGRLYLTTNGIIGEGGGGGAGGSIRHDTNAGTWTREMPYSTYGGRGSYNSDEAIYAPQGVPEYVTPTGAPLALRGKPGLGGGARITPFNKSNTVYGSARTSGVVVIRLAAE